MDWREELEGIYDRHSASLYAFVLNLLRNEDLTRDVLQEVFRKIANRRGILDGVVNERAYLIV
jgi:DNA-directed RNA polymerase specialized sigma24 family protein